MKELFDAFDERATLRILLQLTEKDKNLTTLLDEISGAGLNALNKALDTLKVLGLVEEKNLPYSRVRLFTLTDKGKRAAEKILELKKIIEEE